MIDEVDDDVLIAQENVGDAQEHRADQEQLHQVIGAGDRQVEHRAHNHVGDGDKHHRRQKQRAAIVGATRHHRQKRTHRRRAVHVFQNENEVLAYLSAAVFIAACTLVAGRPF